MTSEQVKAGALRLIPSPARWAEAIRYGLLAVVVLDSFLLYESYRSTRAITLNMQNNVIEEQVFSDLKDAECGQRGFLYTDGDERYLPQYYLGVENTKADMIVLKEYTNKDQEARPIVGQLDRSVKAKLGELDSTIRAFRAGDSDKAREIVNTGTGLDQMDTVRTMIGLLRAREREQLRQRRLFF